MLKKTSIWDLGIVFFMGAVIAITVFLGVLPSVASQQQIDVTRLQVQSDNVVRSDFLASLIGASADMQAVLLDQQFHEALFPARLKAVELVDELGSLSASTGAAVSGFSTSSLKVFIAPASITNDPDFPAAVAEIPVDSLFVSDVKLSLTGSFDQIMAFVDKLQAGPRFVLVHSLVVPENASSPGGPVTADVSAQIFVLKSDLSLFVG